MGIPLDFTGTRLESALVLGLIRSEAGCRRWQCRCDCGVVFDVPTSSLSAGITKRCRGCANRSRVCAPRIDQIGRQIGDLTVIARAGNDKTGPTWVLRCRCGVEKVRSTAVMAKLSGKCLCNRKPRARHPLYAVWTGMRMRCLVKTSPKYADYGGRGIKICERWSARGTGFLNFVSDMGERPPGMSLDRINVNGHYEPMNCRWATPQQQADNQRLSRKRVINILENVDELLADGVGWSAEQIVSIIREQLIG